MIFKSFCLQKPLLRSQECRTCYAGSGLWSGTPRWGYPSHESRGRLRRSEGPSRPAMFGRWIISVTDHANMALTKTKKCRMMQRQITMSLDKRNRDCKTCQHGTAELFASSGQGLLIFDPLDNRNPSLLINYQKVSRLEESQEVGMKWGLGRSASFISACNILAYNIL